jgi:hypothetical protein
MGKAPDSLEDEDQVAKVMVQDVEVIEMLQLQ